MEQPTGHLADADANTVKLYFHYYAKLANQMNMLQDLTRTRTYQSAITSNPSNFANKLVMDVGAGSGVLSFFALQAGARHVFAVEASQASTAIETLRASNPVRGQRISVIPKIVEAVTEEDLAPHLSKEDEKKVDVLVSEPIGTFLFNERMIESYLFARDQFLKPGGRMFPNKAKLYISLFSDAALFHEVAQKHEFWQNHNFFGIDISALSSRAYDEAFEQPVLDYIDRTCLISPAHCEHFDFETLPRNALENMTFNINVLIAQPTLVHGLAGWFDIIFEGIEASEILSTAPWAPPTHWHQIRFLLKQPLAVNPGQRVVGTLRLQAHSQQSYYVKINLGIEGTEIWSESAQIDLKDPDYRWFSAQHQQLSNN